MPVKKIWRTQLYVCCIVGILLLFINNSVWPMIVAPIIVAGSLALALWKLRCPKCGKSLLRALEIRNPTGGARKCPHCGETIELV